MRNLLDEYIGYTQNNIKSYFKLIFKSRYDEEISKELIKTYINVRYYNIVNDTNTARAFYQRIINELGIKANILKEKYEEEKKKKYIEQVVEVFEYILFFDNVRKVENFKNIKSIKQVVYDLVETSKNEFGIKNYEQTFKEELYKKVRSDMLKKEIYLDNFENTEFLLEINQDSKIENIYHIELKYNIPMPMQYSNQAIEKVYNTGIIAEDKFKIEYILITLMSIKDILDGNFKDRYIVGIQDTILSKNQKLKSMLEIINNQAIQEKVTIKITYENYIRNQKNIMEYITQGYNFAIVIDEYIRNLEQLDELKIFKTIIVSKRHCLYKELIKDKKIKSNILIR